MTTTSPPPQEQPQRFIVRTTEDVIALVPHVLGFHPEESLVMLTFGAPAGSFHARVDLPRSLDATAEVVDLLAHAVRANAATTAMVVACSGDHPTAVRVVSVLLPALRRAGAEVVEVVRADGRCWWSLLDPEPVPHPYDVSAHPFAAEWVLAGEVVRESRQAVVDSLRGTGATDAQAEAVEEVISQRRDPCIEAAWLRDWLADRAARPRDEPVVAASEQDAARVLALVVDAEQRDVACVDLTRDRAPALCEVWSDLVRRAPDALVAGPAGLLALTAWLAGDGALAWCAVDRALAQDPDHPLARCVAAALQQAVPPSSWRPPGPGGSPLLRENGWGRAS